MCLRHRTHPGGRFCAKRKKLLVPVIQGQRQNLLGRNWLHKLKQNWDEIFKIGPYQNSRKPWALTILLQYKRHLGFFNYFFTATILTVICVQDCVVH